MELLLDTSDLETIKKYMSIIPLNGVTTNPTIVKKSGKVPFFEHMIKIHNILGSKRTFHVQVVGTTTEEMVNDAHTIQEKIGNDVYVKIPTNTAGLAAMQILRQEKIKITATAIYTAFQGYLAIAAGADYLAPYYNRMINMNIDANKVIMNLSQEIKHSKASTKILAASFHTVQQVNSALENGADAITMSSDILDTGLGAPVITAAINNFTKDWQTIYGKTTIFPYQKSEKTDFLYVFLFKYK